MINALKHPSFFRPASRPSSPAPIQAPAPVSRPDSGVGLERVARPLNKLSSFRKLSPTLSPAPINQTQPTATTVVQDGSYLEVLALKLSEAVSKALAHPPAIAGATDLMNGKRPVPAGRGRALGSFIAAEIKATLDNAHLQRAILRSLHRPLSVLVTNLSAQLVALISSPAFQTPSAPTIQAANPNATQLHALGISTFAGELLETFDELALGLDADIRGDGLKVVREGLLSLVNRVVNPLITGIKNELTPLIAALETPNAAVPKVPSGSKVVPHPSVVTLQAIMPIYTRALVRYTPTPTSQNNLATLLISLLWRGLIALSHRRKTILSCPSSPVIGALKKRRGSPTTTTPALSPPSALFNIKLPPSRPPSPPAAPVYSSVSADARALYDMLNMLPRPAPDKNTTRVAREAVDEAYADLQSLPALLDFVESSALITHDELLSQLELITEELPTLVALPILLRVYGLGNTPVDANPGLTVASLINLPEDEYRKACLSGFARAEECATTVGQRVLSVLSAGVVQEWLENEISEDQH